jgi:hypothetical protein
MRILVPSFYTIKAYFGGQLIGQKEINFVTFDAGFDVFSATIL